jgi:hypothetical protein
MEDGNSEDNSLLKFNISRAAIARLEARQDGVLRNHSRLAEGVYRDMVVFSIINLEWPPVKQSLQFKMNKKYK